MTIASFIETLKSLREMNPFHKFDKDSRGILRVVHEGRLYCPLTYVSKMMGGKYYPTFLYTDAAQELDIGIRDRNSILDAADARTHNELRHEMEQIWDTKPKVIS